MENWIWLSAAAVLAYFVKGLCGFANTLVFSTLLSFTADNIRISPVELALGILSGKILNEKHVRSAVHGMLVLSGAALIVQNLF